MCKKVLYSHFPTNMKPAYTLNNRRLNHGASVLENSTLLPKATLSKGIS